MRSGLGFLTAGVVIIIVGIIWLVVGGPGSAPIMQELGHIQGTPQAPVSTPSGPVDEPPSTAQTPPPTILPSPDAVKLYLVDIAFGNDNINLLRWDPARNNGRIIVSVNGGNSGDLQGVLTAVRQFNSLSATNQISENIKQNSEGDLTIKFVPESGMAGLALNVSSGNALKEVTVNGITAARIVPGTIYLNTNLKGDVRNHTLIRSLFYGLGVVGDSDQYKDSLFFSGDNTNTDLTYIDQKALELLYGKRLQPGMTAGEVRDILSIT